MIIKRMSNESTEKAYRAMLATSANDPAFLSEWNHILDTLLAEDVAMEAELIHGVEECDAIEALRRARLTHSIWKDWKSYPPYCMWSTEDHQLLESRIIPQ